MTLPSSSQCQSLPIDAGAGHRQAAQDSFSDVGRTDHFSGPHIGVRGPAPSSSGLPGDGIDLAAVTSYLPVALGPASFGLAPKIQSATACLESSLGLGRARETSHLPLVRGNLSCGSPYSGSERDIVSAGARLNVPKVVYHGISCTDWLGNVSGSYSKEIWKPKNIKDEVVVQIPSAVPGVGCDRALIPCDVLERDQAQVVAVPAMLKPFLSVLLRLCYEYRIEQKQVRRVQAHQPRFKTEVDRWTLRPGEQTSDTRRNVQHITLDCILPCVVGGRLWLSRISSRNDLRQHIFLPDRSDGILHSIYFEDRYTGRIHADQGRLFPQLCAGLNEQEVIPRENQVAVGRSFIGYTGANLVWLEERMEGRPDAEKLQAEICMLERQRIFNLVSPSHWARPEMAEQAKEALARDRYSLACNQFATVMEGLTSVEGREDLRIEPAKTPFFGIDPKTLTAQGRVPFLVAVTTGDLFFRAIEWLKVHILRLLDVSSPSGSQRHSVYLKKDQACEQNDLEYSDDARFVHALPTTSQFRVVAVPATIKAAKGAVGATPPKHEPTTAGAIKFEWTAKLRPGLAIDAQARAREWNEVVHRANELLGAPKRAHTMGRLTSATGKAAAENKRLEAFVEAASSTGTATWSVKISADTDFPTWRQAIVAKLQGDIAEMDGNAISCNRFGISRALLAATTAAIERASGSTTSIETIIANFVSAAERTCDVRTVELTYGFAPGKARRVLTAQLCARACILQILGEGAKKEAQAGGENKIYSDALSELRLLRHELRYEREVGTESGFFSLGKQNVRIAALEKARTRAKRLCELAAADPFAKLHLNSSSLQEITCSKEFKREIDKLSAEISLNDGTKTPLRATSSTRRAKLAVAKLQPNLDPSGARSV